MPKKQFKYFFVPAVLIILLAICLLTGFIFMNGIKTPGNRAIIYIPTGARNKGLLEWIALRKNYPRLIKPGRYVVEKNLSYIKLINMLRSGDQQPVKVTFNNIRNILQLSGKIARQIEPDSVELVSFLSEPENYRKDGFTADNIIAVFLPNTYELYWNTTPQVFYERMLKEYHRFWTEERLAKARSENITPIEAAILASIIDDEVAKPDEKPMIAGVYLNRLRRGIPLQACPTIKFALNDFTITRVLKK
jgi:peptidoglycan lytic transglycosylase G